MNNRDIFDQLTQEFDLKQSDFYFLDLIPLIEVMWMDGKNQPGELSILYQFVLEHIAYLDRTAGEQILNVEDANDFLDRFAHKQPPQRLLDELHAIVVREKNEAGQRKMSILEYCLDISAACVVNYPYALRERVQDTEKEYLLKLFAEFHISPQQSVKLL